MKRQGHLQTILPPRLSQFRVLFAYIFLYTTATLFWLGLQAVR